MRWSIRRLFELPEAILRLLIQRLRRKAAIDVWKNKMTDEKKINIDDEPSSYGSKGQYWNPAFVQYMKTIVLHPNYKGMPDAIKSDGKIQWEAPSNRSGGLYKDTHHKRRDWWRAKAAAEGISDSEDQWISRVAKLIHPTKEKPCKRCGQILRLAYVYPSGSFVKRCERLFGAEMVPEPLEEVGLYIRRLSDTLGENVFAKLPALFKAGNIAPPSLGADIDAWLGWIEDELVPSEPALLSPGAMSNAPDRFDGFHSFNRCCRGEADTGRHKENMKSYTTDRRVFEYWSEGDWISADRMMGLVRAQFSRHATADGGEGAASADHIGPLSLGFAHRPEFRLLSKAANSAKNNRMTIWDVRYLCERERSGVHVASWYAKPIWDRLKTRVGDEETALRLSKIMRDNQRQAMGILALLRDEGHATFLASLLELHYADFDIEFDGLEVIDFVTRYRDIVKKPRTSKYAIEQKARRMRIGFEALRAYSVKTNRHYMEIQSLAIDRCVAEARKALSSATSEIRNLDSEIIGILDGAGTQAMEDRLRSVCGRLPRVNEVEAFQEAIKCVALAMGGVAEILGSMWDDDRYVRAEFAFDGD